MIDNNTFRADREENDNDIGPLPSSSSNRTSFSSSEYAALIDGDGVNEMKKTSHTASAVIAPLGGYIEPSGSQALSQIDDGSSSGSGEQWQREEWMTDVGENRILTGMYIYVNRFYYTFSYYTFAFNVYRRVWSN